MHSVYQEAQISTLMQLQKMRHRGHQFFPYSLKLLHCVLNVFCKTCSYLPYHLGKL